MDTPMIDFERLNCISIRHELPLYGKFVKATMEFFCTEEELGELYRQRREKVESQLNT